MKDYTNIYAVIFWISLLSILIWVILKSLGIINTHQVIEWFPVISAIFGVGVFFQTVFSMKNKLEKLENRTDKIAHGLTRLEFDITSFKSEVNAKLRSIENKL